MTPPTKKPIFLFLNVIIFARFQNELVGNERVLFFRLFIKPINKETWDLYGIQETWVWGLKKKMFPKTVPRWWITELYMTG